MNDLFDSLSSYLQKMSEDMANSALVKRKCTDLVKRKCTDLHQRFTDTKFILYMLFLKQIFPLISESQNQFPLLPLGDFDVMIGAFCH